LCVVLKCKSTNKKFQIQGHGQVQVLESLNAKNQKFFRKAYKGKKGKFTENELKKSNLIIIPHKWFLI
jgi:hypothetical protein